jgi:hypothetical protein
MKKRLWFKKIKRYWYIDLPNKTSKWKYNRYSLFNVDRGMFKMVEHCSFGADQYIITVSTEEIEDYDGIMVLDQIKRKKRNEGRYYDFYEKDNFVMNVWTCKLMHRLFDGFYPEKLWLKYEKDFVFDEGV